MENELIAIGLVLLIVAAVLMVAVGTASSPLDVHTQAVRLGSQAQLLVNQVAGHLPW